MRREKGGGGGGVGCCGGDSVSSEDLALRRKERPSYGARLAGGSRLRVRTLAKPPLFSAAKQTHAARTLAHEETSPKLRIQ